MVLEFLPDLLGNGDHGATQHLDTKLETTVILAVLSEQFNFFYRVQKFGRFSILVFGPELVSYERSRGIHQWVLREVSARAFL